MFFGAVSFAEAAFASQGFNPNAFVNVLGSRINIDTEPGGTTFTAVGDAQLSTAQAKFGPSSLLLDGTGDFVQSTASDVVQNNFTIEFFAYASNFAQNAYLWDNQSSNQGFAFSITSAGQLRLIQDNTILQQTSSPSLSNNQWNHFALVQNGSLLTLYINGAAKLQYVTGGDSYPGQSYKIGANEGETQFFNGYIDEFRSSDIARYTTTFTPPTSAFTLDDDTSALIHFDGSNGSTDIVNEASLGLIVRGDANLAVTGNQANFTIGNVVLRVNQRVDVTGIATQLDSGVVSITAAANVIPTGSQFNFATGTPTFAFKYDVTGSRINADTGDVSVVAEAVVALLGSELDIDTGSPTYAFRYPVTGSQINADSGDPTIIGKATVLPNGTRVDVDSGTVTIVGEANVSVTGNRVDLTIGNVTTKANATVTVTTNRQNLSTGTVTITADANVLPLGSGLDIGTTMVNVKKWDGVVPGASQVWTPIQTSRGS